MAISRFRKSVEKVMSQVPVGRVTTYGDIAAFIGRPLASRQVGGVAHFGSEAIAWHRLVNRDGGLARGFPGGPEVQAQLLRSEHVEIVHGRISDFTGKRMKFDEFTK